MMEPSPPLAVAAPGRGARAPATAPPVYFLLHLPRTAGQTIRLHLSEHCAPGTVWMPRLIEGRGGGNGARHDLGDLGDPDRVRAVVGHDIGCSLERLFGGREVRRVVLLREPVSHQLSLYNYRMMNHLNKGLGTYSFALHTRAQPRDWVAHRLLAGWLEIPRRRLLVMSDAEKYRILNRMLAGFWFVGGHTECDRLIAAVAPDLGAPPQARARNTAEDWHRQVYWEPLTADALGAAGLAALRRRNPIDLALWDSWQAAGFAAVAVRPRPLGAAPRWRFAADEALRRGYLQARRIRRDWAPRWRRGGSAGFAEADLAFYAGRWRVAAEHYRRGLAAEPRVPAVWVRYGYALRLSGEREAAAEAFREALRRAPDDAEARAQLAQLAAERDPQAAEG